MTRKPTKEEAKQAVRTLIAWAGDNPDRKELLETPNRVVNAYSELFGGYNRVVTEEIGKTFDNSSNYAEMVILREINFFSHCEHHMLPIIGKATVAYIPNNKIIGLSKMARIVDIFAKRLQIQERLVVEIANCLDQAIQPKGVGVMIEASHLCLGARGAHKPDSLMKTSHMIGCFKEDKFRQEFLNQV